jgi:Protein of unknown function (DUF3768)
MDIDKPQQCSNPPRAEAIAQLNDMLRKTGEGGTIMITRGVLSLKGFDRAVPTAALSAYNSLDADNDPHGERDFGDLTLFEADLLWKIDYYDKERKFGSDDPADANITCRVLTIMLVTEW